jgi:outer membrane autotransporter protein
MGRSFMLSGHWAIEPQLQVVHQRIDMDDVALTGARVHLDSDVGWLGRVGVRIKGVFATGVGMLQPYARVNVYKASGGEDVARFIGPAATTDIATRVGNTSTELAAGLTWSVTEKASLYGEVGRLWGSGGERVDSPFKGSIGLRLTW